jgi:hypothetical protein
MARTYNVIDADGHILEPVDIWDKYIDPAYRDRAPKMIIDTDGKERLLVEGKILGSPKGMGAIGGIGARDGKINEATMKYVEGRPGGFDPHARIPDMDLDGIDAAFLYPSIGLFSGAVQDPGLAAAMCRAYNRWLADYCKPYPDRLFGVAMLPMQSIPFAIEEMRFARKELGMRGGFLRPEPVQRPDAPPPGLRALLEGGRGARLLDRPARGRQRRHAAGRRRPVRESRRPAHHLAHDGDDAGGDERDLGRACATATRRCASASWSRAAAGSRLGSTG